jgi:type IV secretion system protein VirB3
VLEQTPVCGALVRPLLFAGADRELVLFAGLLLGFSAFISLGVPQLFLAVAPLSFVVWSLTLWGLRQVAKRDPLYRNIYIRNIRFDTTIPSASTPFRCY